MRAAIAPLRSPSPLVTTRRFALLLTACAALALAYTAGPAAQGSDAASRSAIVAQKVRLLEQLLASPRAQEVVERGEAEPKATLARARTLLEETKQIADAAEAEKRINEALRLATLATRGRPAEAPVDAQVRRNAELRTQVDEYRRGIVTALQARRAEGRSPVLVAVDQHLVEADDLTRVGRHVDAHAELERAYRAAVQGLARLREGETVTIALKFDTPADEYAYEQKRFQSHELLVEMTLTERNPVGSMRNAVEQRRQEARSLRDRASESAARGDYRSAIAQLEEANRGLVRALQAAGVTGLY